ncbi:MAG: FkbM family methyltransferase [Acidimicrobiales bacterium]|nr:FkbM family methyltransferase [Acidimicrobiales bacterium]
MQVWKRHLRTRDVFVDVGAHLGAYTIWAIEQGAEVIAIEADPTMASHLVSNLELNGYEAEVHAVAVAHKPGTMLLNGPDQSRQALLVRGGVGTEVVVDTLDRLLGQRQAAGLKIDVEGAERLVLEGASRILADARIPLIQLEWNSESERTLDEDRRPLRDLLLGAGYELLRPDADGNLLPVDALGYGADVFARATGPGG